MIILSWLLLPTRNTAAHLNAVLYIRPQSFLMPSCTTESKLPVACLYLLGKVKGKKTLNYCLKS